MEHVVIRLLNQIGEDERGTTYDFSIRPTENFILINRKKDSKSGNTYHHGTHAATDPKIFVLLSGKIELAYRHIESTQHQLVIIDNPSIIKINPKVTHSVKALTNIAMLECNAIEDIQNDRYFEEVIIGISNQI